MSVEIDPVELGFHRRLLCHCSEEGSDEETGPFTSEVSQSLKIRNPNRTPVAFKVRVSDNVPINFNRILTVVLSIGQDYSPQTVRRSPHLAQTDSLTM